MAGLYLLVGIAPLRAQRVATVPPRVPSVSTLLAGIESLQQQVTGIRYGANPPNQPDLAFSLDAASYTGIGTFNTTGAGQTVNEYGNATTTIAGYLKVQTYGALNDTFTIQGQDSAGGNGWTLQYLDGGIDVTASAVAGNLTTPPLNLGQSHVYTVLITGTTPGAIDTITVTGTSVADGSKIDVVKDIVTLNSYKPDLSISPDNNTYTGAGIISTDGTNETIATWVTAGVSATHYLKVTNSGNTADVYNMKAVDTGGNGYSVTYYDNGTPISTAMMNAGTYPISVAAGATYTKLTMVVLGTQQGATDAITVTATSSDPSKPVDVVKDNVTVKRYQPDLAIGTDGVTFYYTGVVNNSSNTAESIQQWIVPPATTQTAYFAITNTGNITDTYTLTGTDTGGAGWSIQYKDMLNNAMPGSVTLLPNQSNQYKILITGTKAGSTDTISIQAKSQNDATRYDLVTDIVSIASYQPDMIIGSGPGVDSATSKNVFDPPTVQTYNQYIDAGKTAICYVTVSNYGNTGDSYTLLGSDNGSSTAWTVTYWDNDTQAEVTPNMKNGTLGVSLQPSATKIFKVVITGQTPTWQDKVTVTATSVTNANKDTVNDLVTVNYYQPDCTIDPTTPTSTGAGIFNSTGLNQTISQKVNANVACVCYVTVKNAGNTASTFRVTAVDSAYWLGGDNTWTPSYTDGGTDVTTNMEGGGVLVTLAPNATHIYKMSLTGTTPASTDTLTVTAKLSTSNKIIDTVVENVAINNPLPDLSIGSTLSSMIGVGTINATGVGQTLTTNFDAGNLAVRYVTLQNVGNIDPDTFTVQCTAAGGTGFTITFFNALGTDITTQATNGFSTSLNAGASVTYHYVVSGTVPAAVETITVQATSNTDYTKVDVVKDNVTVNSYLPDLSISPTTSNYLGQGIYNNDGTNQTVTQWTNPGTTATCYVTIKNTGNVPDTYTLLGTNTSTSTGWSIQVIDTTLALDVTNSIGTAVSLALNQDHSHVYQINLHNTLAGATATYSLMATSTANPANVDVVKEVLLITNHQPDMQLSQNGKAYIGTNIFNTTGAGQSMMRNVDNGVPVTYYMLVQNAGNTSDSFVLTGPGSSANWSVSYLTLQGLQDITANVTGTGWTTAMLAPGATADCWVTITPGMNNYGGAYNWVPVKATSTLDSTKVDVAKPGVTVKTHFLPDMQIRNVADASYTGVNIYLPDLIDQTKTQSVNNNATAVFPLCVQNNGNTTDSFLITGPASGNGWTIQYYNATTGGSAITTQVIGGGGTTGSLAPGATAEFRVEVTPDNTIVGGDGLTVGINGTSTNDGTQTDAVQAVTTVLPAYQPDMMLHTSAESTFTGAGIFNLTGVGQSKSVVTPANQTVTYTFRVQNSGNTTDSFLLTGPAASTGWSVQYLDLNATDITANVTGTGYNTALLAPGATQDMQALVTPSSSLATPASFNLLLNAQSNTLTTQQDTVQSITSLPTYGVDAGIQNYGDSSFAGVGIYNLTGASQTKSQSVLNSVMATYILRVQNTGNTTDTFTITAPSGGSITGWKVQYVDILSGADITATITGAGWKTIPLAPGSWLRYTIHITPDTTLVAGASRTLTLSTVSSADASKQDVVKATTTVTANYKPDLAIKNPADAGYTGVSIFNLTGIGQASTQTLETGGEASYFFRVQNTGNTTDTYKLTSPTIIAGWRAQYVDQSTGADVTTSVTGSGYLTKALVPGATLAYTIHVWPGATVQSTAVNMQLITAASVKNTAAKDVVDAVTNFTLVHEPDLTIANAADGLYVGGGIYNTTGTGQAKTQNVVAGNIAPYLVKVQNAGTTADNFTLKGSAASTGWTVQYFNAPTGGTDITSQIVGGTWTTGTLAAGTSLVLRAEVTPGVNVSYTASSTLLISAVSTGNKLDADAVQATTTRIGALAASPWAMLHRNQQHTGLGTATGPTTNTKKWSFLSNGAIYSSPVLGSDGTCYVGTLNNQLVAIQSTGVQKWAFTAGGAIQATPAICADGTIYAGALDNNLYVVNADGTLKRTFSTGGPIHASATIASDGTVYVASDDNKLYALNGDGTLRWSYPLGTPTVSSAAYSSPAVGTDGTVYIGSRDNNVYAIKPNGTLSWSYATRGPIYSSPAIGADGSIYIGSSDQRLYAFNADGSVQWTAYTQGAVNSTPAIGADGTIVVGSNDAKVYAFTAAGGRKWSYTTNNWVISSPAIDVAGNVYVGSLDGLLYAVSSSGTLKWTLGTRGWVYSSPAIGTDGTIYVGSYDGNVYAVGPGTVKTSAAKPGVQPDLSLRLATESTYTGVGIINDNGAGQTKSTSVAANVPATYYCQVTNTGSVTAQFTLKASAPDSDWKVTAHDLTDADITGAITGAGWLTAPLAPGATAGFWIQVIPTAQAGTGKPLTLAITAASASDSTMKDVVKAVTTKQ